MERERQRLRDGHKTTGLMSKHNRMHVRFTFGTLHYRRLENETKTLNDQNLCFLQNVNA